MQENPPSFDINRPLLLQMASPGPLRPLAIASSSMNQVRVQGLALAIGHMTGFFIFGLVQPLFGLGAVLFANVWLFESLRYVGAAYLFIFWLTKILSFSKWRIKRLRTKHCYDGETLTDVLCALLIFVFGPFT